MRPTLSLYENPTLSNVFLGDLTPGMRGWKHRTADWGGFDTAGGEYHAPDDALWKLFIGGPGQRIEARLGNLVAWDGQIRAVELDWHGMRLRRDLDSIINKLRLTFAQYGNNHVVNGGAETAGTYTQYSGPGYVGIPTEDGGDYCNEVVQSSAWSEDGANSFFLRGTIDYGAGIGLTCVGDIVPGGIYKISFTYNLVAEGKPDAHANAPILLFQVVALGDGGVQWWTGSRSGEAIYTETITAEFTPTANAVGPFQFRVLVNASSESYIDNVILFENGTRQETDLLFDQDSIDRFGLVYHEILRGAMGPEQADAEAARLLAEYAWPRLKVVGPAANPRENKASVECRGFIHSLAEEFISAGGLDTASAHIASIVGASSRVTAGIVQSNTLPVFLDVREPISIWDAAQNILKAGDAAGQRWTGGVYANRQFHYGPADTSPRYVFKNGAWCHVGGPLVEAAFMHPGLARYDDAPDAPYQGRDPRLTYIAAVEYDRDADSVRVEDAPPDKDRLGTKQAMRDAVTAATVSRIISTL